MDIHYGWVAFTIAVMVLLILWLFKRNQKDKAEYIDELIKTDLPPEKHEEDKIS
ncbi:hypothetical protein [Pedobacter sp.]|uniref:hypothetical protein n=1 Tax=Pedobacter sp. TaxID=1411316 RepID=UPI003D7FCC2A